MTVPSYTPKPDGFDYVKVIENFNKAAAEQAVDVVAYLDAFRELARFFDMMGALFSTMANDIRYQIKTMDAFLAGPNSVHYKTVQDTIEYEKQDPARLEPKCKNQSGSRTILHLNRILDFFVAFVGKLSVMHYEDKLPAVAQPAYKATVGKYDGWLLQKAAGLAMATLPTKLGLYEKISKYPYEETVGYTADMVKAMEIAFKANDELFTKNDLQTLPY